MYNAPESPAGAGATLRARVCALAGLFVLGCASILGVDDYSTGKPEPDAAAGVPGDGPDAFHGSGGCELDV